MIRRVSEHSRRQEDGFTLIELLVVIVILAILAAVVVFAVRGTGDKGQAAALRTDLKTIRTAEEAFCAKFGRYGSAQELVDERFLSELPKYHSVATTPGGSCRGAGDTSRSGFVVTCTAGPICATEGGTPAQGSGTMVVGISDSSGILNPAVTSNGGVHTNSEAMFNGLLAFDASGNVVPDLAASVPTPTNNPDGTQDVVFTLNSGMKWHNGSDITGEDVRFSFEQALLRYHSRTRASMGSALGLTGAVDDPTILPSDAIITPVDGDPLKVKFHFLYPYDTAFFRQLNVTEAAIIPKAVYQGCSVSALARNDTLGNTTGTICLANNNPVGSGPFQFVSRDTSQIVVTKNISYFKAGAGLPKLNKVVYLNVGSASNAAVAPLKASPGQPNSIDVGGVPGSDSNFFATTGGYQLAQLPRGTGGGNCILTLGFNLWQRNTGGADGGVGSAATISNKVATAPYEHPLFKDLVVRKAIFQGFDRGGAFTNIEFSKGRIADSPYHSALPNSYAAKTLPSFNPAQARADLQAANWIDATPGVNTDPNDPNHSNDNRFFDTDLDGIKDASEIEMRFNNLHFDTGTQVDYGLQLVGNLDKIGIEVIDTPKSNSAVQTDLQTRDYDSAFISYCHGDAPVIGTRRAYHSDQITKTAFVNVAGVREKADGMPTDKMDELWDAVAPTSGATYATLHNDIQDRALALLPYVWINETVNLRAFRAACTGLNQANTGLFVETAVC